ncbi:SDR family oxidoreductase [Salinigranum halophilum]|jgi:NAD(P)-dependent dehydrogenase (short-subunit alcohol dehydrogenase family)|uniref:SDR family oxidoreductase n=1 Tax=Salinigranum halophilum TaxID=2565931 RepID=UPI00115E6697|nr:SDR family oxidoreductase [Salinigranum halophilum]
MDDTTVVITGGSSGIGAACVRAFASEGATVVACARETDAIETMAAEFETVEAVRADVRDEYDVERLMETAARLGGTIDVVVANAGINHGPPGQMNLAEEPYSRFDDTLRTNVRGVFTTIKEAVPHLSEGARLLVPSGSIAREAKPGMGAYAISKAGAEALVRGFATDIDQSVGIVDPGLVATEVTGGQGREAEDVAPMFLWAATDCPAADLDGQVVDLRAWKKATR